MGKNRARRSRGETPANEESYESYHTGEMVPAGNLTEEEMRDFVHKTFNWLNYFTHQPDEEMTLKDMEYIFSHFKHTDDNPDTPDGHLYRFENAYHFEDEGYHVGDKLNGNGSLRSFSKKVTATNQLLDEEFNGYSNIVIYRTVGNAPYFDIGKYSNPYPYQQECLVPLDTMRVKDVNRYRGSGMRDDIYDKYGIDLGEYQYSLDNVTVVDVEYDSKVSSVVDSQGRVINSNDLI